MSAAQLCFDFGSIEVVEQPVAKARHGRAKSLEACEASYTKRDASYWQQQDAAAREYWRVGAVTSLPLMCDIEGLGNRYAYMLPGAIEAIDGDKAAVRIYAAPEYGSFAAPGQEEYPLHLALAINVHLRDLGKYALCSGLQRVVDARILATGDASIAAEMRARYKVAHEHDVGMVGT